MEKLRCKACGCLSMIPIEVEVDETDPLADQESRFYSCHVCGDNWLSVKETGDAGDCTVTFIHQMGMAPILKRSAHVDRPLVIAEGTAQDWRYFLDDEEIDADAWQRKLTNRRQILKSVCSN